MNLSTAPRPLTLSVTTFGPDTPWTAAIAIPARNEEGRIARCLDAAAAAIHGQAATGIVVTVNNTTDATARSVAGWAQARPGQALVLIYCTLDAATAGAGAARRLALDAAAARVGPKGVLLTTDADTCVRPDWIAQNLHELDHADLICGQVLGLPEEARRLPPEIAGHGSAEWDYLTLSLAIAARLDPRPHDPDPAHHNAAGASLAFRRSLYLALGGLPPLPVGEDRAFAALAEAQDYRLRHSRRAIVETSCRMTGRTAGGMAGALRARATEADPFADEWLEPAATFILRNTLRGRLRACWPNRGALHQVLSQSMGAERITTLPKPAHFGAFFAMIEATSPALTRARLRLSDCRVQVPMLRDFLAGLDHPLRRSSG